MAHNTIKTRIQLKNDTEAHWNLATNFIPREGEIIVYSADGSHPFSRLKVGDGNTNVINLPFIDAGTINGSIPTFTDTNTTYTFSSLPNGDGIHILSSDDQIQIVESEPDSNGGIVVTIGENANEAIVRMNAASDAMRFLGTTSTSISDGNTTATITLGSTSHTATTGNVVVSNGVKYVWDGNAWRTLASNLDSYFSQTGDMVYKDAQGIATLSIGQNGNFLMVNNGVPYWGSLSLPTATDTVSGITKLGATGGAATYSHSHGNINNDGTWGGNAGIIVADSNGTLSTATINPSSSESSTSTDKYVSNVTQNSNGSIAVTKSPLPEASTSTKGMVFLGTSGGAARYEDIVTTSAIRQDLGITGDSTSTTFLRKDGSWVAPSSAAYSAASNGGLALTGTTFSVAEGGITNAMLAGNISNNKLANDATITIGTQNIKVGNSFNLSTLAADLGITGAMTFIGITSTVLEDGDTTSTLAEQITGSLTKTTNFIAGDVVISGHNEFIWTGQLWEKLGGDSSYKVLQEMVPSPRTGYTPSIAFIDTISQDINGEITVSKAPVQEASTSQKGIIQIATTDANGAIDSEDTTAANMAAAGNHAHYYAGSSTVGGPATEVAQTLRLQFGPLNNNTFIGVEDMNQYTYKGDTAKTVRVVPGTDLEITTNSNRVIINHEDTVEASNDILSAPNTSQTPAFGATFNVPVIKKNARGHITAFDTTTVTIPAIPSLSNTDAYTGTLPITKGGTGTGVLNAGETGSVVVRELNSETLSTRAIVNNTTSTAAVSSTGIPTMATLTNTLAKINGLSQSGDSSIYAPTSAGSSGQVLKSNGTGAPVWESITFPTTTLNNSVTAAPNFYAPTTSGTTGDILVSNGNSQAPSWSTFKSLVLETIYPVGSIYITTDTTSPATLFGGTWERYSQGRVLLGYGGSSSVSDGTNSMTFDTLEATGGKFYVPGVLAHTHSITGSVGGSDGTHTHGSSMSGLSISGGNHTHSHTLSVSSHYHDFTVPDHRHYTGASSGIKGSGSGTASDVNYDSASQKTTYHTGGINFSKTPATGTTGSASPSLSGSISYSTSHSHTISGSVTVNSTSSGHGHSFSLTASSRGDNSVSNLQPYVVVYIWKRTV